MPDENSEQYILQISAQDQASTTVDQLNARLEQTDQQLLSLNAAAEGFLADLQAIQIAEQQAATIPFDDAAQSMDNLAASTEAAIVPLDELAAKTSQVEDLAIAWDSVRDSAQGAAGAEDDAGNAGGGGFNPSALSTAGRLIGGPAGHALRAAGQVSRLADMLPEDTAALADLGLAAGIAAPAVVATALAVKGYTDQIRAQKSDLDAEISALDKYHQALATDTTAQAQKQIEDLQKTNAIIASEMDTLQGEITSSFQQAVDTFSAGGAAGGGSAAGQLIAQIADAAGQLPTSDLQTKFDALKKEFTENTDLAAQLTQGLTNQAFASNAAADAAQRLDDTYNKLADQAVQNVLDSVHKEEQAQQMTQEQRAARVTQDLENMAVLEAAMKKQDQSTVSGYQNYVALNTEYEALNDEVTLLSHTTNTYADQAALAAEKQSELNDQFKLYTDAITNEGKISEKLVADQAALDQVRANAATKEQTLYTDDQAKLSQIASDGAQKRQEIETNDREARAKILREFAASDLQDIGARDAYADAQARTKEQLDLANQDASDKKALDAEAATEAKQIQLEQTHYAQSLSAEQAALTKEQASKEQAIAQDQAALTKAQYDEASIELAGSNGIQLIHGQMYANLTAAATTFKDNFETLVGDVLAGFHPLYDTAGQAATIAQLPISNATYPTPLPAVTGTAAGQNNSGNGARSINMTINGVGMGIGEIINHVLTQFDAIVGN